MTPVRFYTRLDKVPAIDHLGTGGVLRQVTDEQISEMLRLSEVPPFELGLPYGRWSLSRFREYLIKNRIIKKISREHLRRLLKKGACAFATSSAKSSATILNGERF